MSVLYMYKYQCIINVIINYYIFFVCQEEKLRLDEEEARFQAEERTKAIERAKTLLYYNTDRVKTFHVSIIVYIYTNFCCMEDGIMAPRCFFQSDLVLSEVLREREQQIKCKHIRKGLMNLQEKEYLKMKEEEREKGILEDIEAATKRAKAQKETHQYQLTQ